MRQVAAGVAVVTTDGPAGRHGATVSTFCSVSADPPTVLIYLGTERLIAKAIEQNHEFCVNVLCQQQIDVANRFARREDDHITDRFSGIECSGAPDVSPALDKATVFSYRIQKLVNAGSHLIVIGQVSAAQPGDPTPLTYVNGIYHALVPAATDPPPQAQNQHYSAS